MTKKKMEKKPPTVTANLSANSNKVETPTGQPESPSDMIAAGVARLDELAGSVSAGLGDSPGESPEPKRGRGRPKGSTTKAKEPVTLPSIPPEIAGKVLNILGGIVSRATNNRAWLPTGKESTEFGRLLVAVIDVYAPKFMSDKPELMALAMFSALYAGSRFLSPKEPIKNVSPAIQSDMIVDQGRASIPKIGDLYGQK
jgi:hypothetical protein